MSMSRSIWPAVALFLLSGCLVAASCNDKKAERKTVREVRMKPKALSGPAFPAQVAGRFYPGDATQLRKELDKYLPQAEAEPGDLMGIFVPHAGYPYSGPVAGKAFAQLRDRGYRRAVVLGPAHRRAFGMPAVLDAGSYATPLGKIPIDTDGVKRLVEAGVVKVDAEKFRGEHALEVELPFLQRVLGSDFLLVPIMLSGGDPASAQRLAEALLKVFPGRDTVFVASTDMSHDFPYAVATAMDERAVELVQALDGKALHEAYQRFRSAGMRVKVGQDGKPDPDCAQLCGMGPVLTLMELARQQGAAEVKLLDRRNSGDIVGDKNSRIVGYFSAAVMLKKARPEGENSKEEEAKDEGEYSLSEGEKAELLTIARQTLERYLKDGEKPDFETKHAKLKEHGAAFVTLKNHGRLRGCIGYMEPIEPLWEMIRNRAVDAATRDGRFKSVTADELKDIHIEISVLSPRMPVEDPLREIEIGRDGVWIQLGMHRGVFLPQVPVEQNWTTVEQYLSNLCRKAHVFDRDCWKNPQAKIQRFTAIVFSEEE